MVWLVSPVICETVPSEKCKILLQSMKNEYFLNKGKNHAMFVLLLVCMFFQIISSLLVFSIISCLPVCILCRLGHMACRISVVRSLNQRRMCCVRRVQILQPFAVSATTGRAGS